MTDRELLEKAAKAAGIKLHVWGTHGAENFADMDAKPYGRLWNPLTEDGDAFRLLVRLGLFWSPELSHFLSLERFACQERDDCHAHRRAIVRAAAAVGKDEQ